MTNQRISEIKLMLSKADFVWLGRQRIEYSRDNDGNYEPDREVYDDVGSIGIDELHDMLRVYEIYKA